MSDLIERAKESAKWAEAENDHLSESIFNEMIEGLEKDAARIRELEAERDKWRDSAESYRKDAERIEPLLAKIASIPLWRDTYSDGPDMIVTGILGKSTDGFTADDVRLARAILKPSGDPCGASGTQSEGDP